MELAEDWVAFEADEELRRVYPEPDFDDSAWHPASVPGQWAATPWFADADGPILYRTRFGHQRSDDARSWLEIDGIFNRGDVWLDGGYVGATEGYFVPHDFEITDLLGSGPDHVLAIEVDSPPRGDPPRRVIAGAFHDDPIGPGLGNPGGIWRPVRVVTSGPVRIRRFRVTCREATAERAVIALRTVLDAAEPTSVTLVTSVAGVVDRHEQPLAAGENQVDWTVTVPEPELWWPHSLGAQPLHDLAVTVDVDGGTSDQRSLRIGFRQVELDGFVLRVNGERLFTKGITAGPTNRLLSIVEPAGLRGDIVAARDAGLDLVRLHTHVSRPELYAAADELGMLLWQDLPLHGSYARGVRGQAVAQAEAMVDLLGHHASIALWCAHDEPPTALGAERGPTGRLLAHQVPTWNRALLDRAVKRTLHKADPSRPVLAHSGVMPHLPRLDGTDAHVAFGWSSADPAELADYLAGFPSQARWVSVHGAQSIPDGEPLVDTSAWPEVDWTRLQERFGLDRLLLARVPPSTHQDWADWRDATQRYQAHLLKTQIEILRRLKYRPAGGFTVSALADGSAAVSTAVLDVRRQPKLAYQALTDACRPVIVVAGPLPTVLLPGELVRAPVHVISDRHGPTGPAEIRAVLHQPGHPDRTWRWDGIVPFDDCALVGHIAWTTTTDPGRVVLDLELTGDQLAVTNRYEVEIAERRLSR